MNTFHTFFAVAALAMLVGCGRPFDVNVSTAEPIEVNLNIEAHVYQHGQSDKEAAEASDNLQEVLERRRNRMAEIQTLKDNRLIGETHEGLLEVRNLPAGDYGDYTKSTVDAENADRNFLIKNESTEKNVSVSKARADQWEFWQRKSFPGEWIEVEGDEPGTYRWIQKEKASE